jgi:transcriptional regulator with XRE-family HTH domain
VAAKAPSQPQGQSRVALLPFTKVVHKQSFGYRAIEPSTLGEHLRRVRLERGLRQVDLAEILQVTPSTVVHWEQGSTSPLPSDGPVIATFLGHLPAMGNGLSGRMLRFRFAKGLTQRAAAELAGVSEDGWRAWEGGAAPTAKKLALVERALRDAEFAFPATTVANTQRDQTLLQLNRNS